MCRIVADTFEAASGIPDELSAAGVDVHMAALVAGDYDLGRGVLAERKAVVDLHLSLERGRLWAQVGRLRARAKLTTLAVRREWP